jgi:integrase
VRLIARLNHWLLRMDYDLGRLNERVWEPNVANWALSSLPKCISATAVQRVLDECDRQTAVGRRNYAVLLLLARLGMRGGEVLRLNLEDID